MHLWYLKFKQQSLKFEDERAKLLIPHLLTIFADWQFVSLRIYTFIYVSLSCLLGPVFVWGRGGDYLPSLCSVCTDLRIVQACRFFWPFF